MTYPAVKRRCEDCPHNAEALLGEAQAQYLERVIEDEDDQLAHLRVCATCRRYYSWRAGDGPDALECDQARSGGGLDGCRCTPSQWVPYWLRANRDWEAPPVTVNITGAA